MFMFKNIQVGDSVLVEFAALQRRATFSQSKMDSQKYIYDSDKCDKADVRNVPKNIIQEFIELYRAHPSLWQITNKEVYANKKLKHKGYQALLRVWKKFDPNADIRMVKTKIQSIRGSFRKELKKVLKSKNSESGTKGEYKPQLWYFSMMHFLRDLESPTESIDNLVDVSITTDERMDSSHSFSDDIHSEQSQQEMEYVHNEIDKGDKGDVRNVPKPIVQEFIESYRAHPSLWQITNKKVYGNKNLKCKAYQALLQVWKKFDPNADIRMVKSKIQSIRGSFRKELKKVLETKKSGTEEVYKPQLWYFSKLQFLIDQESPTESIDNSLDVYITKDERMDSSHSLSGDIHSDESQQVIISTGPRTTSEKIVQQPRKRARKLSETDERTEFLAVCNKVLNTSEKDISEYEAFGTFVAAKLKKAKNDTQRMFAEELITKTLNFAILGKLSEQMDINTIPSYATSIETGQGCHPSNHSFAGSQQNMCGGRDYTPKYDQLENS